MTESGERVFRVDEVEALIPRLELVVARLQENSRKLRERIVAIAGEQGVPVSSLSMPSVLRLQPGLHRLVEDINACVHEIENLGGVFKDVELGLIDFPAQVSGERVYLCWQYGEKCVGFWHGIGEGFAGRRPLTRKRGAARPYLQ